MRVKTQKKYWRNGTCCELMKLVYKCLVYKWTVMFPQKY